MYFIYTTGHDVFASGHNMGSIKLNLDSLDRAAASRYQRGVFHLLVYVPIVCALLQLLAWTQFSLRGKRLRWVKACRGGAYHLTV